MQGRSSYASFRYNACARRGGRARVSQFRAQCAWSTHAGRRDRGRRTKCDGGGGARRWRRSVTSAARCLLLSILCCCQSASDLMRVVTSVKRTPLYEWQGRRVVYVKRPITARHVAHEPLQMPLIPLAWPHVLRVAPQMD